MKPESRAHRVSATGAPAARPVRLAVLVLVALAGSPAWASGSAGPSSHQEFPLGGLALGLVLLGVAGLGAATRGRSRQRVALGVLALLVAVSGVETAIHSVHHLADGDAAASCAFLGAFEHVPGAVSDASSTATPGWTAGATPSLDRESPHPPRAFRPDEGRAPPTVASA